MGEFYEIEATPDRSRVASGSKMSFQVKLKDNEVDVGRPNTQWYVWYSEYARKHENAPDAYTHPQKTDRAQYFFTFKWPKKYTGNHYVSCVLYKGTGKKKSDQVDEAGKHQLVLDLETVTELNVPSPDIVHNLHNPVRTLTVVTAYVAHLERLENTFKTTDPAAARRHADEIKELRAYRDALDKLLHHFSPANASLNEDDFWPIIARFHDSRTQKTVALNVALHPVAAKKKGDSSGFAVIDWTNPIEHPHHKLVHGHLGVTSHNITKSLEWALEAWEDHNHYPPGDLLYTIPLGVVQQHIKKSGKSIQGKFETGKKSVWVTVGEFLGWIGGGASIGALVFGVLLPGSAWATGLVWTALFSSTSEAVINIGVRLGDGRSNWREDLFDVLTLLSNMFTLGSASVQRWNRGARVLAKPAGQNKTLEYLYIGQIGVDSFQGVLVTLDELNKLETLMQDTSKSPAERTREGAEKIRALGRSMLMMAVGIKMGQRELKELSAAGIDAKELEKRLQQLADPNAEPIDLTKPPSVKKNTKNRRVKTKTRHVQPTHPSKAKKQPKGNKKGNERAKKLGLGLKNKKLGVDYSKWSKKKGFKTYADLGSGKTFGEQIETAMDAAEEIHFNLEHVRVTGAKRKHVEKLNDFGEPMNGHTNYELHLISTNKKYADKVTWWVDDKKMPPGWWPEELNDPR